MGKYACLALGLCAAACGGRVVGAVGPDGGGSVDVAPPLRGQVDGSVVLPPPQDATTHPPPPVDAIVIVVDAGPDLIVGRACNVVNNTCPAGSYCLSTNCNTGNCVVAPTSDQESPLCGCDRLTYWNHAVAASNAASIRVAGACPAGIACNGGANGCAAPAICNLELATAAACNLNNPVGRCWVLPDTCPPPAAGIGPMTRRCNGNMPCQPVCDLITAGRVYFVDPTCPQ